MSTSHTNWLSNCALFSALLVGTVSHGDEFATSSFEEIPPPHSTARTEAVIAMPKLVGSASCTAASCHGGSDRARVSIGDPWSPVAYSMWIASDPHAHSYSTLLTDESARMVAKLGLGAAHEQQACLACHAPEGLHSEFTVSHRSTPFDGVGCEACHGPAERWLDPHKNAGWAGQSAAHKESLGFRDLDDLGIRSHACADCHVGSPGRDVNHDLIAAGHPRLMFEMSALHARLPKHWRDERDSIQTLDAKLWSVGQAVSATKSLAQLEARAANPHAAWPEFSEYDCYACHHNLAEPSWRQENSALRTGSKPGSLRWGEWNYALLPLVRGETDGDGLLAELRQEMSQTLPNRDRARSLAQSARWSVAADVSSLAAMPLDLYQIEETLRRISQPELVVNPSWDFAAQRFLGLAAMHYSSVASSGQWRSQPGTAASNRRLSLVELRRLLQFAAPGEQSRYNSPQQWDAVRRQQVREQFDVIHAGVDHP
ncbi:MAG: multiheme c-type cytochrome [Aeoliella sp.]